MKSIIAKLVQIKSEADFVPKNRRNETQKFNFRSIDQVYASLQKLMAKHGVISMPEVIDTFRERVETRSGHAHRVCLTVRFTFYSSEDGSSLACVMSGEGMDSGDKATAKAHSVAEKYCLIQVFKLPTEEAIDPDAESHEIVESQKKSLSHQAPSTPKPDPKPVIKNLAPKNLANLSNYIINFGKVYNGRRLADLAPSDITKLQERARDWIAIKNKNPFMEEFLDVSTQYLALINPSIHSSESNGPELQPGPIPNPTEPTFNPNEPLPF